MLSSSVATPPASEAPTVSIRPGVSILSVLRHLNYKPWFALAEFVDNSLQSFLSYRPELERVEGDGVRLQVTIELSTLDGGQIVIRDNAAGIHQADYSRAFRPAERPPDNSGLCEFGMGMKSAACWFASRWTVRTSALGEPIERTVSFDIDTIVRDDLEELSVRTRPAAAEAHYTEIVLSNLHKPPQGRTIGKIKDHLASIYRIFIRQGLLYLCFDREMLGYSDPAVLIAPDFRDLSSDPQQWLKKVDLDFGLGLRVHGFAGLRERGSVSEAGFALFRRNRLIQGSGEESYRPELLFGKSNSFTYQRLFGELHLEGFEVSHTKDGFQWAEHEEIVLAELRAALNADPLPLLSQAEGYRARQRTEDLRPAGDRAVRRTADAIQQDAPPVLQWQLDEEPDLPDPEPTLPPADIASRRTIDVQLDSTVWRIELELSNDPAVGDWVSYSDQNSPGSTLFGDGTRRLGIRLALAHPFTERFCGAEPEQIEPLLRLAAAIVLGEITAREGGVRMAGVVRRNVNQLLRDALSRP